MTPTLQIIRKEQYLRSRWKNGLGYTDQIAIYPETADLRRADFLWRLSSARIEQASDFSLFPAHDRVIVIIRGEGMRLEHAYEEGAYDESVDLPLFEPYEFPGDVPSRCRLAGGPVTDLSVFVRKAEASAQSEVLSVDGPVEWQPQGRWNFIFAAEGACEIAMPDGRVESLEEGDTARIDLSTPLEGEAIVVRPRAGLARVVAVSLE